MTDRILDEIPIETSPPGRIGEPQLELLELPSIESADDIADWLTNDVSKLLYTVCDLFDEQKTARAEVATWILFDLATCCDVVAKCLRTGAPVDCKASYGFFSEKILEALVALSAQPLDDVSEETRLDSVKTLIAALDRGTPKKH